METIDMGLPRRIFVILREALLKLWRFLSSRRFTTIFPIIIALIALGISVRECYRGEDLYKRETTEKSANTFFDKGRKRLKLSEYKEAISDFDKAIEINPAYMDAYYYRGLTRFYIHD